MLDCLATIDDVPENRIRILTLREINGKVEVRNLDAAEARSARGSFNLELR